MRNNDKLWDMLFKVFIKIFIAIFIISGIGLMLYLAILIILCQFF